MRADRAAGTEMSAVQVSMCTGTYRPQSRFSHASVIGINSAPKRSDLNAVRKVTYRREKIGFIMNNAGCAARLRQQAKEEQRGPDPSWSRWKAETTAARSVTGRD